MTTPFLSPVILAVACVLAPLAAFALIVFFFQRVRVLARWTALAAISLSAVFATLLLLNVSESTIRVQWTVPWFYSQASPFEVGVLLDPLSLVMLWIVALISALVQMYSFSYMEEDPSQPRFFAFISLFSFAMMSFTIAPNLLQAFASWELVGLGSYLLIGFWYHKPEAALAARKAFVVTRLGDLGFFAALLVCFGVFGTLDYGRLAAPEAMGGWLAHFGGADVAMWISLGLFCGVAGKSAQFPLYAWLPDAMEGPTPVSALIHAATMVAAGVYLLARTSFILAFGSAAAASAWHGLAVIAMLTVLLSGGVAVVQNDIKRVLAYSTISQLGYMVVGIATGAAMAGMMHLFTHAFFKALLFLAAGALIHATHSNSITDIARAGGSRMKLPMISLFAGSLALCGIFPFAGFYSKDAILEHLLSGGHWGLFAFGLLGVVLTAYYSFRMIFLLLAVKAEEHGHALHTGRWMIVPLSLLSLGALFAGMVWNGFVPRWFEAAHEAAGHEALITSLISTALALLGILYAARVFYWRTAADPLAFVPNLARTLSEKWYLDHAYSWITRALYMPVTGVLWLFEVNLIKGALDSIGSTCVWVSRELSRLQSGVLQRYLALLVGTVALGICVLLLY